MKTEDLEEEKTVDYEEERIRYWTCPECDSTCYISDNASGKPMKAYCIECKIEYKWGKREIPEDELTKEEEVNSG